MRNAARPQLCFSDTGGTFTDTIIVLSDGRFVLGKSPTIPDSIENSYFESVRCAMGAARLDAETLFPMIDMAGYSTSIMLNTILTYSGRTTGLLITKGCEDYLLTEQGRQTWEGQPYTQRLHSVTHGHNRPLIPRALIKGITERIDCFGRVVIPMYENEVEKAFCELVEAGIQSLAICFLHSYLNKAHEQRAFEIVEQVLRKRGISIDCYLSANVNPVIGEFRRLNATILEAYAGTKARAPLLHIQDELRNRHRIKGKLFIVLSTGGLASAANIRMVDSLGSSPASGLLGARYIGEMYSLKNLVATDSGGTTFDVGVVISGIINVRRELNVGSFVVGVPSFDIRSIGAGGGTQIRINPISKRIEVGPHSAGAMPGPVCYDRGGKVPTITDVDLILGYLNPDFFLGGRIPLNKELSYEVFKEQIADQLGQPVYTAAEGIRRIFDRRLKEEMVHMVMAKGIRLNDCALLSYGGAGPVHVAGYTQGLPFSKIMVFPYSGVFSAFGAASSLHERMFFRPVMVTLSYEADTHQKMAAGLMINEGWERAERVAINELESEGLDRADLRFRHLARMRYRGQLEDLSVVSPVSRILRPLDLDKLVEAFESLYGSVFSKASKYTRAGYQVFDVGIVCSMQETTPVIARIEEGDESPPLKACKGMRQVYFFDKLIPSPLYDMDGLLAGNIVTGPAIVEHPMTSLVIPPSFYARVDEYGTFFLESKMKRQ